MADGSPKTHLSSDLRPAFPGLYRQHAGMVRRALRQLGVPPGSLDDAVQDVFVVLHRRIDDFERDRSLTNWLWGIARGVASGYRRSQRRRDRLHAVLPAPEGPSRPERGVARQQAAAILDDFLGSLDDDKCAVFVLSEVEGRRGPEIAELLDVNVNTVYARLRAARKRFDAAMARHRAPEARPVLAAWLPWAWPAWLGKPAVAVGVGAVAVAATVAVPRVAVQPVETTLAALDAPAAAGFDDEGSHRWPAAVAPRVRPEFESAPPAPVPPDDERVRLDDPPGEVVAVVPRRSAAVASSPGSLGATEPVEAVVPELVLGPPPRAPWATTVQGDHRVHHPSLVEPRQDFVSALWRIALDVI